MKSDQIAFVGSAIKKDWNENYEFYCETVWLRHAVLRFPVHEQLCVGALAFCFDCQNRASPLRYQAAVNAD